MQNDEVLRRVDRYYTGRLREHGPTPKGVDWNSETSQRIRFRQLCRLLPAKRAFSVLDFGCGYGALAAYLRETSLQARYTGFDVSAAMIDAARQWQPDDKALFTDEEASLTRFDYTVASGVLNVKMDVPMPEWERHVYSTIDRLATLGARGFAFNALTAYSDPERMRDDLYYPDPHALFDYCRTKFSRWVALLHDYGLYEFTIIVRMEPEDEP